MGSYARMSCVALDNSRGVVVSDPGLSHNIPECGPTPTGIDNLSSGVREVVVAKGVVDGWPSWYNWDVPKREPAKQTEPRLETGFTLGMADHVGQRPRKGLLHMAKNDTPNEGQDTPAPETPDIQPLEAALAEAKAKLDTATAAFMTAGSGGDMKAMLEAADAVKAAQRVVERAQAAVTAATFEIRAGERMALAVEIKGAVETLIQGFNEQAHNLAISGVHVTFLPDGTFTTSITDSAKPAGKRNVSSTRTPGTTGEGKGRNLWLLDGRQYTSRELLLERGGAEGQLAVEQAAKDGPNGWVARGLKAGPGFDAAVKKLAAELGATRVEA